MRLSLFMLSLLLSGCSAYNETFDCAPGKGVGCQSLNAVNLLVDQGKLPLSSEEKEEEHRIQEERLRLQNTSHAQEIRVWIAPYRDDQEVLHEASYVSAPMKEAPSSKGER